MGTELMALLDALAAFPADEVADMSDEFPAIGARISAWQAVGCPRIESANATPAAKVGDIVTASIVGGLPVGTVVEWGISGVNVHAKKTAPNVWESPYRRRYDDGQMADSVLPATIVSLPTPDSAKVSS